MKPVNHQQTISEGEIMNAGYENHILSHMQNDCYNANVDTKFPT